MSHESSTLFSITTSYHFLGANVVNVVSVLGVYVSSSKLLSAVEAKLLFRILLFPRRTMHFPCTSKISFFVGHF